MEPEETIPLGWDVMAMTVGAQLPWRASVAEAASRWGEPGSVEGAGL